jgi:hypothetical protein
MKRVTHVLAGAILLTGVGVASAEQKTINEYVRDMIEAIAGDDDILVDQIRRKEIDDASSAEFIFDIDPDKAYFVYSACDDDCSDIDLAAHDADEDEVDSDDADDDTPVLIISPGSSGDEVHVVVDMIDCDADSCVVGVGLYEMGD